jgi:hypothetical protein
MGKLMSIDDLNNFMRCVWLWSRDGPGASSHQFQAKAY